MKTPLLDALAAYPALQRLPLHVPAHAGQGLDATHAALLQRVGLESMLPHDLTELDGLDVLATPEGCIAESQALTAERWGVAASYYLVNGSSGGVQALLLASLQAGDWILVPRNAHRSVLAGLILCGANPLWCLPEWDESLGAWGGLTLDALKAAHSQQPSLKAVWLTHPTYDGLPSPLAAISAYCQAEGLLLLVDEAHGALFATHPAFPDSACHHAVDGVVQSLHKTAGSLTQSAVLHLPHGSRLSPSRMAATLGHLQSTSPSYPLLASLDAASAWVWSESGQARIAEVLACLEGFKPRFAAALAERGYALLSPPHGDPLRWTIRHPTLPAETWAVAWEEEGGISFERLNETAALYLIPLAFQTADADRWLEAIRHLPASPPIACPLPPLPAPSCFLGEQAASPRDAFFAASESIALALAVGRISAETIVHCPPGIPILCTGERISEALLPLLAQECSSLQVLTLSL